MEKYKPAHCLAGKPAAAVARPEKSARKKRPGNTGGAASKPDQSSSSRKSKRKTADKPGRKSKKKSAARGKAARATMKKFKDARPSDVSDKVFVASSPVHGKGLFAARKIKANTVLGRLHGMPTFDDGIYVLWITDDLGLELTNDFKYINHSKNANAAYSDIDVTVLRDVEAGEELLHDYGW